MHIIMKRNTWGKYIQFLYKKKIFSMAKSMLFYSYVQSMQITSECEINISNPCEGKGLFLRILLTIRGLNFSAGEEPGLRN